MNKEKELAQQLFQALLFVWNGIVDKNISDLYDYWSVKYDQPYAYGRGDEDLENEKNNEAMQIWRALIGMNNRRMAISTLLHVEIEDETPDEEYFEWKKNITKNAEELTDHIYGLVERMPPYNGIEYVKESAKFVVDSLRLL